MAKNYQAEIVTQVRANKKLSHVATQTNDRVRLHTQCFCTHRDQNASFALLALQGKENRSQITNAPLYRCRECEKRLDISSVSEEEFNRAFDTIDRIIDLAKISLNLQSEADQKAHLKLSKLQYKNNTMLPDAFKGIRKNGNKKNNREKNAYNGMVEVGR